MRGATLSKSSWNIPGFNSCISVLYCPNISRSSIHGLTHQRGAFRWFLCCLQTRINANRTTFYSSWIPARRLLGRAKRNHSGRLYVFVKHSFLTNWILLNKNENMLHNKRTSVVRQKNQCCASIVRNLVFVRQSCDCITSFLRQSCDCLTTVVRQSYDYFFFIKMESQDSDTTKNRRANEVHVQFSSHARATMPKKTVRLSYDDHRWPAIWQNFMSWNCIDVSFVRCDQGLTVTSVMAETEMFINKKNFVKHLNADPTKNDTNYTQIWTRNRILPYNIYTP